MSDDTNESDREKQKLSKAELQSRLRQDGRFWSLFSIVKELALREGLTKEEFHQHFQERQNYYHDQLLDVTVDLQTFPVDDLYDQSNDVRGQAVSLPPLPFEK